MRDLNETPLDISWLNNREKYDRKARSREVLDVFLAEAEKAPLKLADLGSGTGSNSLFLSEHLQNRHAEFHLVERETYLLEEARRRIKEKNATCCGQPNEMVCLKKSEGQHAFYFYNELVSEFICRNLDLRVACASALFDLFTKDEFDDLLTSLKSGHTSLYGALNYCGTEFFPSCEMDKKVVGIYEKHMSRSLLKGRPMGRRTMKYIRDVLNRENGWDLTVSNSNWVLKGEDSDFISQNLKFYENAVPELIFNRDAKAEFHEWMREKQRMIAERKLEMRVYHQDFFARCL